MARLDHVLDSAREAVPLPDGAVLNVWLLLGAVPDFPGRLDLRADSVSTAGDWLDSLDLFPPAVSPKPAFVPGFRCLRMVQDWGGPPKVVTRGGEMQTDGGAYVLAEVGESRRKSNDVVGLWDETLASHLLYGMGLLAAHAHRAASSGGLQVAAQLVSAPVRPQELLQTGGPGVGRFSSSYLGGPKTPISYHSAPIELIALGGPELVAFTRLVMADLVSAFGLPEPRQITEKAVLRLSRFDSNHQPITDWCERVGVEFE